MEKKMDSHNTKFHHQKVNHIMAGEARFKLTKTYCQNYYQDIQSNSSTDNTQKIPYIEYNWKPDLEGHPVAIHEK